MNLEEKHLLENNRIAMIMGFVVQIFMIAATILYREGRWLSTPLMVVIEVICFITAVVGFSIWGKCAIGHYFILLSLAVDYMLILLGSFHTVYMWAFGTLIGAIVIVYADTRICAIACAIALVENIIFVVIYYAGGFYLEASSRFMVPTNMAFIVLFTIIAFTITATNSRQTAENLEDIQNRADAQLEQAAKAQETSDQIAHKLEDAGEAMASLSEKVVTSREAVDQISSSVSLTAEAIQTQTEMNSNISESLENISDESKEVARLTELVKTNVDAGNVIVTELEKQAEETAEVNKQTVAMTDQLAASAGTVKDIVNAILSISKQTNLLALNASIEAARAGEAGKGFAVVAEEIRQLSEDTKSSAEQIQTTINELIASVDAAGQNMNRSVESSNRQGEMVKETGNKFAEILSSVKELSTNVQQISDNVESCAQATSKVTDAISDLSAMSEEVAASSESSLSVSNECVKDMEATNDILKDILVLSRNEG